MQRQTDLYRHVVSCWAAAQQACAMVNTHMCHSEQSLPGELRLAPHAPSPGWYAFYVSLLLYSKLCEGVAGMLLCMMSCRACLASLGVYTEGGFQQVIHLLRHLHVQAGVGTGQDDVLLGLLTLPLHGLPLCILLLAQLHQSTMQQQSANLLYSNSRCKQYGVRLQV